jgi:hypothetical protein
MTRGCGSQEAVLAWVKGVVVFARILVHSPGAVQRLFEDAVAAGVRHMPAGASAGTVPPPASGAALLTDFVACVADSFDRIALPGERKLCAMALARALTLPAPPILSHLELVVCQLTGVWNALEGGGASDVDPAWLAADFSRFDADALDDLEVPVSMSEDAQGAPQRLCASTCARTFFFTASYAMRLAFTHE